MAQSRVHSFGTIYTRVKGLLRTRVMKESEKPLWYDVYEAFPPKWSTDRVTAEVLSSSIQPIFYAEDRIRAKFYTRFGSVASVDTLTTDPGYKSLSQQFIDHYRQLQSKSSNLDEDEIFNKTVEEMTGKGMLQTVSRFSRQPRSIRLQEPSTQEAQPPNIDVKGLMKE